MNKNQIKDLQKCKEMNYQKDCAGCSASVCVGNINHFDSLIDVHDAMLLTKASERTIQKACVAGKIFHRRFGCSLVMDRFSLIEWDEKRTHKR